MTEAQPLAHRPHDLNPQLPEDPRLVVTDIDGTLVDADGALPAVFWDILNEFRERGITFAVASGRHYLSLRRLFDRDPAGIVFISDNGGYVVRDGAELAAVPLDRGSATHMVEAARELARARDLGVVWSSQTTAHTERHDSAFLEHARGYYPELTPVDDLVRDAIDPIKVSILELDGVVGSTVTALARASAQAQVTQTSDLWIDVTAPGVNKGTAVTALQAALGIGRDHTVAFGDHLNDLEMMDAATYSFAMANAHPEVVERARAVAPSNAEHGAVRTMARLLGLP